MPLLDYHQVGGARYNLLVRISERHSKWWAEQSPAQLTRDHNRGALDKDSRHGRDVLRQRRDEDERLPEPPLPPRPSAPAYDRSQKSKGGREPRRVGNTPEKKLDRA